MGVLKPHPMVNNETWFVSIEETSLHGIFFSQVPFYSCSEFIVLVQFVISGSLSNKRQVFILLGKRTNICLEINYDNWL